jgi:hypothetical protein
LAALDRRALVPWMLAHIDQFEQVPGILAPALDQALAIARECDEPDAVIAILEHYVEKTRTL